MPLAYSTALLPPSLTVRAAPRATEPVELVREILAPHGLTLRFVEGLYIVVRAADASTAAVTTASAVTITVRDAETGALIASPTTAGVSNGLAVETLRDGRLRVAGTAQRRYGVTISAEGFAAQRISLAIADEARELEVALAPLPVAVPEIVVTASRYELVREAVTAPFYVDQRAIAQQPDFGDDPLRALHRLPGAASGVSAKAHLRGGELNETAVVLNGQRLLDPFHIRDYQSMFSAIDVRAIDGMEVYTGGFPVRYGDSMGALVLIDGLDPHEPRHSELGLSVLNTSALSAGTIGDGTGSWLVSARRSNLEDVVHERLGEPSYYDFFGELGINFSARTQVSVNALTARDRVGSSPKPTPPSSSNPSMTRATPRSGCTGSSNGRAGSRARRRSRAARSKRARRGDGRSRADHRESQRSARHRRLPACTRIGSSPWATRTRCRSAPSINGRAQTTSTMASADYFGFFLTFPNWRRRCAAT